MIVGNVFKFFFFRISDDRFEDICQQLIELFPCQKEFKGDWFEPAKKEPSISIAQQNNLGDVSIVDRANSSSRRGALYNSFLSTKRLYKKAGLFRHQNLSPSDPEPEEEAAQERGNNLNLKIQKILILNNNLQRFALLKLITDF